MSSVDNASIANKTVIGEEINKDNWSLLPCFIEVTICNV